MNLCLVIHLSLCISHAYILILIILDSRTTAILNFVCINISWAREKKKPIAHIGASNLPQTRSSLLLMTQISLFRPHFFLWVG